VGTAGWSRNEQDTRQHQTEGFAREVHRSLLSETSRTCPIRLPPAARAHCLGAPTMLSIAPSLPLSRSGCPFGLWSGGGLWSAAVSAAFLSFLLLSRTQGPSERGAGRLRG